MSNIEYVFLAPGSPYTSETVPAEINHSTIQVDGQLGAPSLGGCLQGGRCRLRPLAH